MISQELVNLLNEEIRIKDEIIVLHEERNADLNKVIARLKVDNEKCLEALEKWRSLK